MWIQNVKGIAFFTKGLFILLLVSQSESIFAEAHAEFHSLGCYGCHGEVAGFSPVFNVTHETLQAKIHNDMPANDPSLCVDDCAHDMANLLLPTDRGVRAMLRGSSDTGTLSSTPITVTFSPSSSECSSSSNCTLLWDFGNGNVLSQTTSDLSSLPDFTRTYTEVGDYHVTLTVTDNATGDRDFDQTFIYIIEEESFASYVASCKSALNFSDSDIPDDLNCATAHEFAKDAHPNLPDVIAGHAVNDYVGHRTITDQVDLVFACRWLQNDLPLDEDNLAPPFVLAESVEMLMHNRENGETCFFKAKPQDSIPGLARGGVSVELVSPTVAANAAPGSYEAGFWETPMELAESIPCTDCHSAGPYIATPRIAPLLAQFGLLNDGHDTYGRSLDASGNTEGDYHIAGTSFSFMNAMAGLLNNQNTCANGCHAIEDNSTDLFGFVAAPPNVPKDEPVSLIPSINQVLSTYFGIFDGVNVTVEAMPAHDPISGADPDTQPYTWINRDTPLSNWNDSDIETFAAAKSEYATLLSYCGDPGTISAHTVGSMLEIHPQELPQNVRTFNGKEGLVCVNSDTSENLCFDYSVAYQCQEPGGLPYWTNENNRDTPAGSWEGAGDYETKADHQFVCDASPDTKTVGVRATYVHPANGWTYSLYGPMDRLAQFDRYGLVCHNTDQIDGQCSNYVVQFRACSDEIVIAEQQIESLWSGFLLTAAGSGNDADVRVQPEDETWNTQGWLIEPVSGTSFVRIKNIAENRYLNVQNNSGYADVVLYQFEGTWGSQQWLVEDIPGSSDVRLRNVWSGYYLTVSNNGSYADLKAQALTTSWPSQRWQIN